MKRIVPFDGPVQLQGFNNLTKSLSFNLYDFCVARNDYERQAYVDYIHERYNAARITDLLQGISKIIEARVLAVSDQDYSPWGASSLLLMSDLKGNGLTEGDTTMPRPPLKNASPDMAFHLDKSHICAHTYPDFRAKGEICSFRIDIDISTCGEITPLKALNYMFSSFDSDVVVIDYRVRGYTRDLMERRVFMDHEITSIQDYIRSVTLNDYHCVDLALQSDNIWQTKMLRTRVDKQSYFLDPVELDDPETKRYLDLVRNEMRGLLYMWPE